MEIGNQRKMKESVCIYIYSFCEWIPSLHSSYTFISAAYKIDR